MTPFMIAALGLLMDPRALNRDHFTGMHSARH
jgi:hypothetical protein